MKVLFFSLSILFISSSCEREDWQSEHPQPASSTDKLPFDITGQHGSYLIKLDGKSREIDKVAAMPQAVNHYDAALSFNDLPGDDKQVTLLAMVKDSLNDITVLGDAVDFASGKYDAKMIREKCTAYPPCPFHPPAVSSAIA